MIGCRDANIPGIVSLSADTIFDYIYSQSEVDYTIKIANYELYLEKLRDLSSSKSSEWNIYDVVKWGKILKNHQSSSEIIDYYEQCFKNSLVAPTLLGETSSRSHNIFIISIKYIRKVDDQYFIKWFLKYWKFNLNIKK